MSTHRRYPANAITFTVSALLGLGLLAGCTSGGSGSAPPAAATAPSTAAAGMSASALVSAARSAVTAGGSVHLDITAKSPNGGLVAFSDDATASGGRQVITFNGTGRATILLIDGVDYVQADAETLQGFFDVPLQQAVQAAGQWISVRQGEKIGTSAYDDITAGITLSSVAQELQFGGQLSKSAPATVAGQPVIGVQAPLPASDDLPGAKMVLYVTDNAALRPVRYELVGGGSTTNEFSFSRWGEKLTLTAPAHAVPASAIGGSVIT